MSSINVALWHVKPKRIQAKRKRDKRYCSKNKIQYREAEAYFLNGILIFPEGYAFFFAEIRHLEKKFKIEKLIENPNNDYKELERELEGYEAILVAGVNASLRNGIAKYCIENNVRGYFAPHVGDIITQGSKHILSFHVPIFSVRRAFKDPFYLMTKRVFDFTASLLALIILSPIYLAVSLAVKLSDGGSVLY